MVPLLPLLSSLRGECAQDGWALEVLCCQNKLFLESLLTASWQVGLCPLCSVIKTPELLLQPGKYIGGIVSYLL